MSLLEMLSRVVLDHHGLGYLAVWYGGATLITGLLLLTMPKKLRRISHYIRLLHLLLGLITASFGLTAYLVAPG